MSTKVEVLCPTGHRISVKVTPNSKILQILEEVCLKQQYSPDEYELRHGKRSLDVALSVRLANLPNLAKLELVKSESARQSAEVSVILHLDSGKRLQHTFPPSATLWQVIEHWRQTSEDDQLTRPGSQPCCVYIREEIIGEYALSNTTLRALGLISGTAIIRLSYRDGVTDDMLAQIRERIDREQARQLRLTERVASSHSDVTTHPTPVTEPVINPTTPVIDHTPLSRDQAVNSLNSAAVSADSHMDVDVTPAPVHRPAASGRHDNGYQLTNIATTAQQQDFSTFKFPEETRGQNLYRNELSEVRREDYLLCDRHTVVYCKTQPANTNMEASADTGTDTSTDLPDDFFDVTVSDLRLQLADLQRSVDNDTMLMTGAMRKAMWEARFAGYERAVLRIYFPAHVIVQAVFRPRETVYNIHKFVRDLLQDKHSSFYLYTTPPRTVLSDQSQTLIEAHLVPLAVVYVGVPQGSQCELSAAVLDTMSTLAQADATVAAVMGQNTNAEASTDYMTAVGQLLAASAGHVTPASQSRAASASSHASTSSAAASGGSGKVPKWFKTGK